MKKQQHAEHKDPKVPGTKWSPEVNPTIQALKRMLLELRHWKVYKGKKF